MFAPIFRSQIELTRVCQFKNATDSIADDEFKVHKQYYS